MDKQKRLEQLGIELARLEKTFQAHHEVPGHPDLCNQAAIQIKVWDCLLGTPESQDNIELDWTASLDRKRVLKALRMAVRKMEYDSKLDEFFRLRAETTQPPPAEIPPEEAHPA
jgi:hypothetical protein